MYDVVSHPEGGNILSNKTIRVMTERLMPTHYLVLTDKRGKVNTNDHSSSNNTRVICDASVYRESC